MDYSRTFAGDIEANGLLDKVSKVWCIVHQDIETEEMFVYHDFPEFDNASVVDPADGKTYTIPKRNGSLIEGARFWYRVGQAGGKLVIHNALSYDKPLLERFYPKCLIPISTWHDTLIQSKVQWFDRETPKGCKGAHGLQAFGARFGINKPEIKNWTVLTEQEWEVLNYYEERVSRDV